MWNAISEVSREAPDKVGRLYPVHLIGRELFSHGYAKRYLHKHRRRADIIPA